MLIDRATAEWIAWTAVLFDAATVLIPQSDGGYQPLLFPRTLCRGARLQLTTRKRKKRKRSHSRK